MYTWMNFVKQVISCLFPCVSSFVIFNCIISHFKMCKTLLLELAIVSLSTNDFQWSHLTNMISLAGEDKVYLYLTNFIWVMKRRGISKIIKSLRYFNTSNTFNSLINIIDISITKPRNISQWQILSEASTAKSCLNPGTWKLSLSHYYQIIANELPVILTYLL